MPRRPVLTVIERDELIALPIDELARVQHYTLSDSDLAIIRQRRGDENRLGFAVQLCYLRFPGRALGVDEVPDAALVERLVKQLGISAESWDQYAARPQTRVEHFAELQTWLKLRTFDLSDYRRWAVTLADLAQRTDRGFALAEAIVAGLRGESIVVPSVEVIERICAEALTHGTRRMHTRLIEPVSAASLAALDQLLVVAGGAQLSRLSWLRQPSGTPRARHILTHLERLKTVRAIGIPPDTGHAVHSGRLAKLAREGGQMTSQHLRDLEPTRRHATLVAVVLDTQATLIDEVIDLHDRFLGAVFSRAKRTHAEQFQNSGKAISEKVRLYSQIGRALLAAKESGAEPYAAIEKVISWAALEESVTEAEHLAGPANFDHLAFAIDGYGQLHRYVPALLDALDFRAAPAARDVLAGIVLLRDLNARQARKVPDTAPTSFIRKRWADLVRTPEGLDRRFYELCVMSELRNSLRSGDIWVPGSRQHRDFDEYLLPAPVFRERQTTDALGLPIAADVDQFLGARMALLKQQLVAVESLAAAGELPDAAMTAAGHLRISPLTNMVPDEADALIRASYGLLPHVKITELLLEVDQWTGFSTHFTHLKSGQPPKDTSLLLSAVLSDAINLGLRKMAEASPGITVTKLGWLQAWHVRDETYAAALAEIVNAQSRQPFAARWGHGATSSSDGQNFKAGGRGLFAGHVNLKYGQEPGVQFYTHISDQYAPFHSTVISATVRDSTHVLDGLLYHESDLRIEEHYTDTAGFTDHVFALTHLLGYRFAPRIRGLADKRLYIPGKSDNYPSLKPLIGGSINTTLIRAHWDDILRLTTSIKSGTVTASLMLRKLGSYPRQNGLATALRELGRLERTLFTLDWMQNPELRRRVQTGLNKGEARNALARAVFFNRLGELRDRSYDNQRHRASGLNLLTAAITLWNTVYLEHTITTTGHPVDDPLLDHLSPLGWEHINLTGDYTWNNPRQPKAGKLRPLRRPGTP
ncbi:Tn3 family transposase [Lacisediminihabitans sp. H27-G8]|uniref:Tn3 family transposase n=1 Tax=Lacisediminihabitans sp. H27-G8 TaxID=3111909 RepID=UPI0038FD3853